MTPNSRGDEFYSGEVVFGALVVSSCDATELFDPIEETLYEVALPVNPLREDEGALAVCLRRDVGPSLSFSSLGPNGVGIIALVGQQDISLVELVRQRVSLGAVGDLAAGQTEGNGTPFRVDERVDFACKPAAGTSHASVVSIPFFPVAACW